MGGVNDSKPLGSSSFHSSLLLHPSLLSAPRTPHSSCTPLSSLLLTPPPTPLSSQEPLPTPSSCLHLPLHSGGRSNSKGPTGLLQSSRLLLSCPPACYPRSTVSANWESRHVLAAPVESAFLISALMNLYSGVTHLRTAGRAVSVQTRLKVTTPPGSRTVYYENNESITMHD